MTVSRSELRIKPPNDFSTRLFLSLHVPKTAGSMFRTIIQNNFGDQFGLENPLFSKHVYSAAQIDSLFALYPYRIYSGHVFRLLPSLDACGGMLNLIAFVRDPVEKARSAYYYLSEREMTRPDHLVKRLSFIDMVDYVIANAIEDSFVFDSSQLDWLVGIDNASMDPVTQAVCSGRLLLFPTEAFDLACILLERIFPTEFVDCSYPAKHNTSRKSASYDPVAERREASRLPWIARDAALYEYARATVSEYSNQVIGPQSLVDAALQDFHNRCLRRVQTADPITSGTSVHRLIALKFARYASNFFRVNR